MIGKYKTPLGKIGPRTFWAHYEQLDDGRIKMVLDLPGNQKIARIYPRVLHARMKAVALAFFRKARAGEDINEGSDTVELAVNEAGSIERVSDTGGAGKSAGENTGSVHGGRKRRKHAEGVERRSTPAADVAEEGDTEDPGTA